MRVGIMNGQLDGASGNSIGRVANHTLGTTSLVPLDHELFAAYAKPPDRGR